MSNPQGTHRHASLRAVAAPLLALVLLVSVPLPGRAQETGGSFGGGFGGGGSGGGGGGGDGGGGSGGSRSRSKSSGRPVPLGEVLVVGAIGLAFVGLMLVVGHVSSRLSDAAAAKLREKLDAARTPEGLAAAEAYLRTLSKQDLQTQVVPLLEDATHRETVHTLLCRMTGADLPAHREPWGYHLRGLPPSRTHVVVARLAVDWRSRRALQAHLLELARSGKTGTRAGRAELLRETTLGLVRAQMSWLYAAWSRDEVYSYQAEERFRTLAADARSRFQTEVVRAADGARSERAAPAVEARATEGEGVVVVTVVAATDPKWAVVPPSVEITDAGKLREALLALGAIRDLGLVAMEVVWSPAVETDRLSTSELEQLYPELRLIDAASVAGRVFCAYCSGPFPRELLSCPHCGAPVVAPGA